MIALRTPFVIIALALKFVFVFVFAFVFSFKLISYSTVSTQRGETPRSKFETSVYSLTSQTDALFPSETNPMYFPSGDNATQEMELSTSIVFVFVFAFVFSFKLISYSTVSTQRGEFHPLISPTNRVKFARKQGAKRLISPTKRVSMRR